MQLNNQTMMILGMLLFGHFLVQVLVPIYYTRMRSAGYGLWCELLVVWNTENGMIKISGGTDYYYYITQNTTCQFTCAYDLPLYYFSSNVCMILAGYTVSLCTIFWTYCFTMHYFFYMPFA